MDNLTQLSPAHCVLLATHCAAESNVDALRTLSLARPDAFDPDTLLRILLTFLPESADPSTYSTYAQEIASRLYLQQRAKLEVDAAPVKDLSDSQAQKRVRKLDLLPLAHSSCAHDDLDLLTLFLIHRAYRIDAETGLLALIPQLVDPFLDHSEYLRTWFISNVLPLLRLDFEYYPNDGSVTSLEKFGGLHGSQGVDVLVAKAETTKDNPPANESNIARDIKGIVGPWMYGADQRKRRKVHDTARRRSSVGISAVEQAHQGEDVVPGAAQNHHDWEYVYAWMVRTAPQRFDLVSDAVEYWDGPGDVDLGGYEDPSRQDGLDEEVQARLEQRYAQAAFASVYSADSNTRETIEAAHSVLVRLASIMEFVPPPDLATSVEMLPKIEGHTSILHQTSSSVLQPDTLLNPNHPLTIPTVETFSLLQIFVYSAYILADLGHPISLNNLAKFQFHSDEDGQLQMVNKVLKGLVSGSKNNEEMWAAARRKLIWLWNWGKIGRFLLEKVILSAILEAGQFQLAVHLFLPDDDHRDHLQDLDIEECVLNQVMQYYDNASNGNVTRGGMKKALELMAAFQPWFSDSPAFLSTEALLAATHSLSFYSLTLQHGVPFRPVNIRISEDPVSLIAKILDQNPRSYSKLDDLINIGQHLVAARTLERIGPMIEVSSHEMEEQKELASRRVTGMAIEAALAEDDFETAKTAFPLRAGTSGAAGAATSAGQESGRSSLDASRNLSVAGSDVGSGDEGATPVADNQRREDR
ncbi:CaiB/BaiF family enzyme [Neofusicoccum parvum]|uniref:CaiB/BaiF family enzyme n=1 Tax=Neofusicoccum parvum TaxID=310453 RepID=A0ACB5S5C4_9PEZI|nr:CaiB/BaiF family enzyme [Neofusicoccum parvum]